MKIKYALMGSTKDPMYLDLWPIVSKVWKKKFDITPVLGLISNRETDLYESEYGLIKEFKSTDSYRISSQSQLIRLFLPKYLEGISIISDIDMIPLSKKYFIDDLELYNDDDFIVMSSHHEQTIRMNQYPMCYIAGNSKNFDYFFDLKKDWHTFFSSIPNWGWYSDQVFLYESINHKLNDNVKFPYREFGDNIKRIDRSNWKYDEKLVTNDYYIDCHLLRPYSEYKKQIDKLIDIII